MMRVQCDVEPEQSPVDGLLASAYQGTDGRVALVLVNLARNDALCDLGSDEPVVLYTTSDELSLGKSEQSARTITVPARAVATVCFASR